MKLLNIQLELKYEYCINKQTSSKIKMKSYLIRKIVASILLTCIIKYKSSERF